jgi:hypothetical protein
MRILLMEFGFDIIATEEEKYDFVIKIADARSGLNQKAIPENECFFEMPLIVRFHGRVLQKKLPNINFIDNKKA